MTYEGPMIANKIIKGIQNLMKRDNVKSLDNIRGIASNVEIADKMAKNGL